MGKVKANKCEIYTLTTIDTNIPMGNAGYCHWSEGLTMVIKKNGVTIKLYGDEIKKLVGSLPPTVSGRYQ